VLCSQGLAGYDATWLREIVFVVRYVGRDATVDVQSDLIEDYVIAAVPVAIVEPLPEYGQRSDERTHRRNGHRSREWDTRAGRVPRMCRR
jgi:hypothetical protein